VTAPRAIVPARPRGLASWWPGAVDSGAAAAEIAVIERDERVRRLAGLLLPTARRSVRRRLRTIAFGAALAAAGGLGAWYLWHRHRRSDRSPAGKDPAGGTPGRRRPRAQRSPWYSTLPWHWLALRAWMVLPQRFHGVLKDRLAVLGISAAGPVLVRLFRRDR